MGKHEKGLRIDRRVPPNFAEGDLPAAIYLADDPVPPAPPTIPAPTNLQLTTYLTRSAQAGTALIAATWDMQLNGFEADSFAIQVSTISTFDDGATQTFVAQQESAAIENLKVATLYYVRVQAIYRSIAGAWSAISSITTPTDTTPPGAVTSINWQWLANGDLTLIWAAPTSENYKDAEVRIYTSATKTLQLRTLYGRNGVTYTAAMNLADTGNVPVASVYVEVYSRSYTNVYGPLAVPTSNPFKARPATPSGLTSSWAGDTGLAAADCVLSWSAQSDAVKWRLSIDSVARDLAATVYTYAYDANRTDHANVADPSLAISLVAVDGLNQTSATPATLNPVNLRPPSTTATTAPGFSTIGIAIITSMAADFKDYILRVIKDGATVATLRTPATTEIVDLSNYGSGSYQVGVSVADVFNQVSAETLSAAVSIEPLTLAELRVDASYDDDLSSGKTALDALKDANTLSGGVSYF